MFSRFKLCEELTPSEICIVVEQYTEGRMVRIFHEHVPVHRLSKTARIYLLRMLVLHFSGAGPKQILHSSLNRRGRSPPAAVLPLVHEYLEAGVLRRYCGGDTIAWADEVIAPGDFRRSGT